MGCPPPQVELVQEAPKTPDVLRAERLQKGWVPFTEALAFKLGIKNMRRMIGVGIRNTARMLNQNDILALDGGAPRKARRVMLFMLFK